MTKICILSPNQAFAEDLAGQITRTLPETEICFEALESETDIFFVDEDKALLSQIAKHNKPVVLLSSFCEHSEQADMVIKKPFALHGFLQALKNGTLLPKIRRKECLVFKEYSFYPVKKEINSAVSGENIKLTEKEVVILKYLYQNAPNVVSKEDLLENVWGYSTDVTTHTIETHIYRLRQKVEQNGGSQLILTENSGYRLNI